MAELAHPARIRDLLLTNAVTSAPIQTRPNRAHKPVMCRCSSRKLRIVIVPGEQHGGATASYIAGGSPVASKMTRRPISTA